MQIRWGKEQLDELKTMAAFRLSMDDAAHFLGVTRSTIAGAADRHGIRFHCDQTGPAAQRLARRDQRRINWTMAGRVQWEGPPREWDRERYAK